MSKTHFSGAVVETDIDKLTIDGAISKITAMTVLNGVNVQVDATLADGEDGQKKIIVCTNATNSCIVTPANLAVGTTITFDAAYEVAELVFYNGAWITLNTTATVA